MSMVRVSDLVNFARYSTPPGMFVDLAPVHVLSQTSLATIGAEIGSDLDVRRFRPNVLLALDNPDDELPESHWTGARLDVGGVSLDVLMPTIRCVVPSRAQPGFDVDRRITKAVASERSGASGSTAVSIPAARSGLAMTYPFGMPTPAGRYSPTPDGARSA